MKDLQPPLPEPQGTIAYQGVAYEEDWISSNEAYTETQLLAYRAEVIEMCAKFVEARFDECEPWVTPDDVRSLK